METPLTVLAFDIAYDAFKNDVDKGGMPYIYHPIRVALRCSQEKAIATALLHDVIEDTDVTKEDIQCAFGDRIADLVSGESDTPHGVASSFMPI